jgi:hypothetical protein
MRPIAHRQKKGTICLEPGCDKYGDDGSIGTLLLTPHGGTVALKLVPGRLLLKFVISYLIEVNSHDAVYLYI